MAERHEALGEALFQALRRRRPIDPISGDPTLGVDDAYRISEHLLARRLAEGERVVGRKIGVTSEAVQRMLGVHQPDFGHLTDAMRVDGVMSASKLLIQPRVEAEIAFVLGRALPTAGVRPEDVAAAAASAHLCFEVVDSRIRDWRIGIVDTVADNASSGLFTLGPPVDVAGLDPAAVEVVVEKNGRPLSRGLGSAVQGSPWASVAWLANTLGAFGVVLEAGEIVLSGSLVPLEPVAPGDHLRVRSDALGELEVRFT